MTSPTPSRDTRSGARILSFSMLLIGCIFLCTPNVNLFDLLPDAIGYLLLMLAVRRASEVFPHFDVAYENFRRLLWISVAKIPATLIMMYIMGRNMAERGIITVFAVSFAIIEWIFAIPAFRNLFEGFVYLGEREGVVCALRTPRGKSVDNLSILSIVFLLVRGACSFLPETVLLSTFEYNGSLELGAVNPATFYPFLAIIAFVIALAMGLVWLFSLKAYFGNLKEDEGMRTLLEAKATLLAPELQASDEQRHARFFFFFLAAGFLFAIDPLIGNRDLLPNAFAALAFFFAFRFCEAKQSKYGKILSLGYFAVSVTENVFTELFFAEFKLTDIAFRDAALVRYAPVVGLRLLESVLFFLTVLCAMQLLKDYILTHTGKGLRPEDLVLRNEVHEGLLKRVKRLSFFSAVYALLRPIVAALMAVTTRHVITEEQANQYYSEGTTVYSSAFSWLWIVLLVVGIAVAVYVLSLQSEVKTEAQLKKPDSYQE